MPDSFIALAIGARFLDRLAASPRGRAYLLAFLVGAEEGDEAGVFDALVARVDDPELVTLVKRHRDDELRHARVFRECLERQPVDARSLPVPPAVVQYVDGEADGFGAAFVAARHSVMQAYLLLQVIEERGVEQYPLIANAIAPYDPESATAIREVAADELRHIKYAKAIAKRYAPDEATLTDTLARMRGAEARGFVAHGHALFVDAIEHDLLAVGPLERQIWRGLARLRGPAPKPRVTAAPGAAAIAA